jgi:hypothetical protein
VAFPLTDRLLAAMKAEPHLGGLQGTGIETEAAPIRDVVEMIATDADPERAIRCLIALMVLRCDPLAIALTAAASAQPINYGLKQHWSVDVP